MKQGDFVIIYKCPESPSGGFGQIIDKDPNDDSFLVSNILIPGSEPDFVKMVNLEVVDFERRKDSGFVEKGKEKAVGLLRNIIKKLED